MPAEFHYFAYSFAFQGGWASVYIGYHDQLITKRRIALAKEAAGAPPNAVLLAVSYLGYMSAEVMEGRS